MRISNLASWREIVEQLKQEYKDLAYANAGVVLLQVVIWKNEENEVIKLPITTVPTLHELCLEELDRWKEKRYVVKKHYEEDSRPVQSLYVWVLEASDEKPAQLESVNSRR